MLEARLFRTRFRIQPHLCASRQVRSVRRLPRRIRAPPTSKEFIKYLEFVKSLPMIIWWLFCGFHRPLWKSSPAKPKRPVPLAPVESRKRAPRLPATATAIALNAGCPAPKSQSLNSANADGLHLLARPAIFGWPAARSRSCAGIRPSGRSDPASARWRPPVALRACFCFSLRSTQSDRRHVCHQSRPRPYEDT